MVLWRCFSAGCMGVSVGSRHLQRIQDTHLQNLMQDSIEVNGRWIFVAWKYNVTVSYYKNSYKFTTLWTGTNWIHKEITLETALYINVIFRRQGCTCLLEAQTKQKLWWHICIANKKCFQSDRMVTWEKPKFTLEEIPVMTWWQHLENIYKACLNPFQQPMYLLCATPISMVQWNVKVSKCKTT